MSQKAVRTKNPQPKQPTKPAPELQSLEVLIGKWNNAIEFKSDPDNTGTGSVTYEWMEGQFFIVERFEHTFKKEGAHKGLSIIGYDNEKQSCLSHFFDNHGNIRTYKLSIRDGAFTINGEWERYTGEVSEDGNTITGTWEQSKDGSTWEYLCDVKQTRLTKQ
jgi:hypothetical protein